MARIRSIKPEFPQSETIGNLSRDARLLFVLLWTLVDDEGRTRAASRMLASLLYPYDDDAPSLMDGWLIELEQQNAIRRYIVDGSVYLEVVNWLKHQKIDKPTKSKIPTFAEGSRLVARPREQSTTDLDLGSGSRIKDQDLAALNANANANARSEIDGLEQKLREASGLEQSPAPALFDLSPILGLIDAGFDLETEILPTIRAKAKPSVGSWKFFVQACHDSRSSRRSAANGNGLGHSARAPPQRPEKRNPAFEAYEHIMRETPNESGT